jgi:uncharacterized cupin superfamily protein
MNRSTRIDSLLATLNAAEVGTLDSLVAKLHQAEQELQALEEPELALRAAEVAAALTRGDVAEFKRGRAFLQSKVGHLR